MSLDNCTFLSPNIPLSLFGCLGRLEKLLAVRATLNEGLPEDEQLSLNDMLLKAAAIAAAKVPDVSLSPL